MENREIVLKGMAKCENKKAEKTEKEKGIEDLGRFFRAVIAYFSISLVSVVERQQGLDYTCDPEESKQASDEHEHLPFTNIGPGEMAFSKYYTDYQKYNRLHQLKKLQS